MPCIWSRHFSRSCSMQLFLSISSVCVKRGQIETHLTHAHSVVSHYHWWRQQQAAKTFGISKKIFGWWFLQKNPEWCNPAGQASSTIDYCQQLCFCSLKNLHQIWWWIILHTVFISDILYVWYYVCLIIKCCCCCPCCRGPQRGATQLGAAEGACSATGMMQ